MAITITDTEMTSDLTNVTARYSDHAAADGFGAWIVDGHPGKLLTRDQAVIVLEVAELLEADS